jgi:hypothetical protein
MSVARTFVWSIVFCGLLQSPAVAQTTPRYKFKEGEKLRYDINQTVAMKVTANCFVLDVKAAVTMEVAWEVLEVNKETGIAKLALKADRFRIDAAAQGRVLVSEGITLDLRDSGEVVSTEGSDSLVKALQKVLPGAMNGVEEKNYARTTLQPIWLTFPAGKLTKGQTWSVPQNSGTLKEFGSLKQEGIYTYDGPTTQDGQKLELLSYQLKLKADVDPKGEVQGKLTKQNSKGHVLFDAAKGRVVEGNVSQAIEMEFTDATGQSATLSLSQEITSKQRPLAK